MAQGERLAIEELAERAGMSVRNIRAHQSRGLLPPPVRVGRRAFYSPEHVQRLRRIAELQRQGFNLAAVGALVAAEEGRGEDARVALLRLALAPLLQDETIVLDEAGLRERFGRTGNLTSRRLAMETGMMRPIAPGRFEFPSRRLIELTGALVAAGADARAVTRLLLKMHRSTEEVADEFVQLCLRTAGPAADGEHLKEIQDLFRRLQELGLASLAGTFAFTVRQAANRYLDRLAAGDG